MKIMEKLNSIRFHELMNADIRILEGIERNLANEYDILFEKIRYNEDPTGDVFIELKEINNAIHMLQEIIKCKEMN